MSPSRHPTSCMSTLCLLLFLATGSSGLLAVDCYKAKDCSVFFLTPPTPTDPTPDKCRIEHKDALEDEKSVTNINAFQRGNNLCGIVQRFNKKTLKYEDLPDPKDLLGGFVQCGRWQKGKECAGL